MRKKIAVLVIGFIVVFAVYASVDSKMDTLWQTQQQQQQAITARAKLQNARNVIVETDAQVQEIADSGSFDLLDGEIKLSLQKAWRVVKDAKAAFAADPNVVELLEWRP